MTRWIDWTALAVAVAFLIAAVAIAMLWIDTAHAHHALRSMPRYIGG